jgi:hypothetical protein
VEGRAASEKTVPLWRLKTPVDLGRRRKDTQVLTRRLKTPARKLDTHPAKMAASTNVPSTTTVPTWRL